VASANALAPGSPARASALAAAIRQIEAAFGRGSVMRLGGAGGGGWVPAPVDVVSTGSLSLDSALGVGGLPRGRVVEIYGPESSGKTTLALHVLAQAQAAGLSVAFVDAEHALDPAYARAVGVDLAAMLLSQPDSGEQARQERACGEAARRLCRSCAFNAFAVLAPAPLFFFLFSFLFFSLSRRRWKSSTPSRGRAPWTSSSSTRWRRWCRAPKLRATWATTTWRCRRG
jgi:hypothetical protein